MNSGPVSIFGLLSGKKKMADPRRTAPASTIASTGHNKENPSANGTEVQQLQRSLSLRKNEKARTAPVNPPNQERRSYTIVVIGVTGRGKSTFCNFFCNDNVFEESDDPMISCPSPVDCHEFNVPFGMENYIRLVDTPGYLSTQSVSDLEEPNRKALLIDLAKAITFCKKGVDIFFLAVKASDRVSLEERHMYNFVDDFNLWSHCILLITCSDTYKFAGSEKERHDAFRDRISSPAYKKNCPTLVDLYNRCNRRFVMVESTKHAKTTKLAEHERYYRDKVGEILVAIEEVYLLDAQLQPYDHQLLAKAREAHAKIERQQFAKDNLEKQLRSRIETLAAERDALISRHKDDIETLTIEEKTERDALVSRYKDDIETLIIERKTERDALVSRYKDDIETLTIERKTEWDALVSRKNDIETERDALASRQNDIAVCLQKKMNENQFVEHAVLEQLGLYFEGSTVVSPDDATSFKPVPSQPEQGSSVDVPEPFGPRSINNPESQQCSINVSEPPGSNLESQQCRINVSELPRSNPEAQQPRWYKMCPLF